jgi:hypothetical protein
MIAFFTSSRLFLSLFCLLFKIINCAALFIFARPCLSSQRTILLQRSAPRALAGFAAGALALLCALL